MPVATIIQFTIAKQHVHPRPVKMRAIRILRRCAAVCAGLFPRTGPLCVSTNSNPRALWHCHGQSCSIMHARRSFKATRRTSGVAQHHLHTSTHPFSPIHAACQTTRSTSRVSASCGPVSSTDNCSERAIGWPDGFLEYVPTSGQQSLPAPSHLTNGNSLPAAPVSIYDSRP